MFSSWKKTLDLAAELLKREGLRHDVIHGSLSLKQRLNVLKDFKSILGPNVLLMTLGTGAEGYVCPLRLLTISSLTSSAP